MYRQEYCLTDSQKEQTVLVSGLSHPELAADVAEAMGLELSPMELKMFPNGEVYARYKESVRGKEVVVLQTGSHNTVGPDGKTYHLNDHTAMTAHMVSAAMASSAKSVHVVEAYMPYSRADRMARSRESTGAQIHIRTLEAVGTYAMAAVDLHSLQTQAITDRPFDSLTAEPIITDHLKHIVTEPEKYIVVAPDEGRLKESLFYGRQLGTRVDFLAKHRDRADSSKIVRTHRLERVGGLVCITIDDMIDTAGTLCSAAESLTEESGAKGIIAVATHGIFSDPAMERLAKAPIDQLIVTDTLPMQKAKAILGDRLTVLPIAPLIGRALFEILSGGSVSMLFKGNNNR